jgi:hypothetical protein
VGHEAIPNPDAGKRGFSREMTGNHPHFPSFPALSYESRHRHLEMGISLSYVCFEQLVMTILYRFPGLFTGLEEGAAGAVILSFIPRLFMSVLS